MKKRSGKSGLPPGSLVHIGEKKQEKTQITILDYDEQDFQEKVTEKIDECFLFKDKPSVTWINVDGVHNPEILEKLGDCYGFHPLVLEDILNTDQRPKFEDYTDYLYIVLRMLYYHEGTGGITTEQVSFIVGPNFVISFQEGLEGDVFSPVRERIRNNKSRLRKMGADYLVYSLIDAIVDNYFSILEKFGERIELLEEKLITNPTQQTLHEIHFLKREMILLRKSVWPLREVVGQLQRGDSSLVRKATRLYLRDLYDHTVAVVDTLENEREVIAGMIDIYLSSVSNRLNEVMKVLTIIATIFIPLTFIVGVYGMNFDPDTSPLNMPELRWYWGYPAIMLVMTAIGAVMLSYFKRKKWF